MDYLTSEWGIQPLEEEEEKGVYTDAFGVEAVESMAPIPPPSLKEGGSTAVNSHRLEMHTGQQKRASKNGEALHGLFDEDRNRPDQFINSTAHERIKTVIASNRQGAQDAPTREGFVERGDVYQGYNIKHNLSRQPKIQTITNRSVQESVHYGAERRSEDRRGVLAGSVDTLKAGAYDSSAGVSQGRRSLYSEQKARTSHTHMGGEGMFEAQPPGQGRNARAYVVGPQSHPSKALKDKNPQLPVRDLKTSPYDMSASRSSIALNNGNDMRRTQGERHDYSSQVGAGVTQTPGALSTSDSILSRDPYRKMSFSESAAIAAQLYLSKNDSTRSHEGFVTQHEVTSRPMKSSITHPLRNDDRTPLPSIVDESIRASALTSDTGRDAHGDSTVSKRYVADTHNSVPGAPGRHSRRGRDDSTHSLVDVFGRGQEREGVCATTGRVLLNQSDGTAVFDHNSRKNSEHTTLLGAMQSVITRVFGSKDSTQMVESSVREATVPHYMPSAPVGRRLGDDGTISRTHKPLAGGSILNAVEPQHRLTATREIEANVLRAGNSHHGPRPMALHHRRGRRN